MRIAPLLSPLGAVLLAACVGGPDGPAAQVAGCVPASATADADDDLSVFGSACVSETSFQEGGVNWTVRTIREGRGPLFVLPHDDENAALATAAYALSRYGGTVTMVETGGRRFNGGIDPNRNFDGGRLTCGRPGRSEEYVRAMVPGGRPVVALHTNSRGSARTGGSGSVSIRAPYAGATAFPASGPLAASEDAMVILASRSGPDDGRIARLTERLNAQGVNVLVETVDTARTDCSLSHYAVANGLTYANVEVAHGDGATQRAILDIVMAAL